MSPIKLGFVGLSTSGWASASHSTIFEPEFKDKIELVAVLTRSSTSSEQVAKKYSSERPVKAYHGDVRQLVNDPDVQMVAVSVTGTSQLETILPAIEAGKDIFLEWPVGSSFGETERIVEAGRKHKIRSIVGLQGRQSPAVRRVHDILRSGEIGDVKSVSIIAVAPLEAYFHGPVIEEKVQHTAFEGKSSTVLDILIGQQLDPLYILFGEIASVTATASLQFPQIQLVNGDHKPTGKTVTATAPDHITVSGTFKESGAHFNISWSVAYKSQPNVKSLAFHIWGTEGVIQLEGDETGSANIQVVEPTVSLNGKILDDIQKTEPWTGNVTEAWRQFASNGDYASLEDALRVHKVIEAIRTSIKERRTVDL